MGDADVTRDQFDETKRVLRKIAQKYTYIVDADFNEAGQISQHRTARLLFDLIKRQDVRFGAGWQITGGTNSVTVSAGDAAIELESDKAHLFHLADPVTLDGWTTPSGSDRTDYLYLDVQLAIIDSGDDPTLINPQVGEETAVDVRLQFTWVKQEGGSVPSPPEDHYYITVATIQRYDGQALINAGDITNHLFHHEPLESSGLINLKDNMLCDSGVTFDKQDPSAYREMIYVQVIQAPYGIIGSDVPTWDDGDNAMWREDGRILRVPWYKKPNVKHIYIRFQASTVNPPSATSHVYLEINGFSDLDIPIDPPGDDPLPWTFFEDSVDVSSASNNADLNIGVRLQDPGTDNLRVRKLLIWAAVE